MKKYALISGGLFGFGIYLHFLNSLDFESFLHSLPILTTWTTITITFLLFALDDFTRKDRLGWRDRVTTNEAYPLLPVTLGYQVVFHALLLVDYPVPEALLALAVFGYYLHRYQES